MDKSETINVAFLAAVIIILVAAFIYVNVVPAEEEEEEEEATESEVSVEETTTEGVYDIVVGSVALDAAAVDAGILAACC
ncbi:MAG: hypothetical protein Q4Q58_06040 [Thermoplasmata archaeon]|nr:hypothetical protein [Thermoplasmata archaeon]